MIDFVISVVSSILGNLLTPATKRVLRIEEREEELDQRYDVRQDYGVEPGDKELVREYNRQRLRLYSWSMMAIFSVFVGVFAGSFLPVVLKTGFGSYDIAFETTRLDWLLGGILIRKENLYLFALWLAVVFFFPVWFAAQITAKPIAAWRDQYYMVTPITFRRIIALSGMLLSSLVCGTVTYSLFPNTSALAAYGIPIMAVTFMMAKAFSEVRT